MKNYLTYRVASSLTLALFFLISACAFNPQDYLGCYISNYTLVNGTMVGGYLPAHLNGTVCEILNYR